MDVGKGRVWGGGGGLKFLVFNNLCKLRLIYLRFERNVNNNKQTKTKQKNQQQQQQKRRKKKEEKKEEEEERALVPNRQPIENSKRSVHPAILRKEILSKWPLLYPYNSP